MRTDRCIGAKLDTPRWRCVGCKTKVLLDEVERAGDEPAEGLLLLRVAFASSFREEQIGGGDDTAYESFWFPRCITTGDPNSSSKSKSCTGVDAGAGSADTFLGGRTAEGRKEESSRGFLQEDEEDGGAFFSFRVANRDNEVRLAGVVVIPFFFLFRGC